MESYFTGGALGTALNGGSFGDAMVNGAIGGSIGAISGGLGSYAASAYSATGILNGALYVADTDAIIGGLSDLAMGGDGATGAMLGFAGGAIGGGITGYKNANATGANIWTGNPATPKPSVIASKLNSQIADAIDQYESSQR